MRVEKPEAGARHGELAGLGVRLATARVIVA